MRRSTEDGGTESWVQRLNIPLFHSSFLKIGIYTPILDFHLSTVSKCEQGVFSPSRLAREKIEKRVSLHPKCHELRPHVWKDGMVPT